MAEDQSTLELFWDRWSRFQDSVKETLEPLSVEQLAFRAAPNLRSVGECAAHMIASRAWWLRAFLDEGDAELDSLINWDDPGAPSRSAPELLAGFDLTMRVITGCLSRWTGSDMQRTFTLDEDGKRSELSRSYVVWHMLQHDLMHGGEVAITLGANGISVPYM